MNRVSDTRYRSRYAAEDAASDEARAAAQANVSAAMLRTFGPPRYTEGFDGGVMLRVSNGTPSDPADVNRDGPGMKIAWQRMVAKAKQEIEEHREHIDWQDTVERVHQTITVDDISELREFCEGLFE